MIAVDGHPAARVRGVLRSDPGATSRRATSAGWREFEGQSWWDFVERGEALDRFQKFLAKGMTRSLVAARAEEMSARTGCAILCQLMQDMAQVDGQGRQGAQRPDQRGVDRPVGRAPARQSSARGPFTPGCPGDRDPLRRRDRHRRHVDRRAARNHVTADYYVAAMPVEKLDDLLTDELRAADPRLAILERLDHTLDDRGDVLPRQGAAQFPRGHVIYLDSEWALTAISQRQFWEDSNSSTEVTGGSEASCRSISRTGTAQLAANGKAGQASARRGDPRRGVGADGRPSRQGEIAEENVLHRFLDPGHRLSRPGRPRQRRTAARSTPSGPGATDRTR